MWISMYVHLWVSVSVFIHKYKVYNTYTYALLCVYTYSMRIPVCVWVCTYVCIVWIRKYICVCLCIYIHIYRLIDLIYMHYSHMYQTHKPNRRAIVHTYIHAFTRIIHIIVLICVCIHRSCWHESHRCVPWPIHTWDTCAHMNTHIHIYTCIIHIIIHVYVYIYIYIYTCIIMTWLPQVCALYQIIYIIGNISWYACQVSPWQDSRRFVPHTT